MEIEKKKGVPKTVAIVAMGNSRKNYIGDCMRCGGRYGVADETWVINKLGDVLSHDMMFRMDDLRIPRLVNQKPGSNKDGTKIHDRFTDFMKSHDKPIITSTAYPEFPTSVAFPLEAVVNNLKTHYLLTTPAYAIAFAIHIGVKHIKIYGCDYVYPDNKYLSEEGRGNCEYLIRIAEERGINVTVANSSTLMGMNKPIEDHLYGYEGVWEVTESDPDNPDLRKVTYNAIATERKQVESKRQDYVAFWQFASKYKPELVPQAQEDLKNLDTEIRAFNKRKQEHEAQLLEAPARAVEDITPPLEGDEQCQHQADSPAA